MSKEVMQQALDALEYVTQNKTLHYTYVDKVHMAINNVREALAEQPAQHQGPYSAPIKELWPVAKPWVGLTDEQIDAEFDAFASKFDHESNEWLDMGVDAYFRAGFKAAHNIKENT